ncbi:neuroglian-like [Babylonia areolata]|uniref:neuroglian-like n=1 Tax=Babylonia areolata TaxID=304850 RepID=UPI003FCF1D6B
MMTSAVPTMCTALPLVLLCLPMLMSPVQGFLRIEGRPADQDVVEGSRVRLVCKVTTNPLASSKVYVRWLLNGRLLNVTRGTAQGDHKYLQKSERNRHALIIRDAELSDSGVYTCVASMGLDSERATAVVTVKGRPAAPTHLEIRSVHGNRAELVWQAGPDHGAKVTQYLLQFNTSDTPDVWYDYFETIPGDKLQTFVDLPPWGTYTFRLIARNELGYGEPSLATPQSCTTPPDRPDRNPKDVITLTHKRRHLIVEWTPMHRLEFHGPGFRYHVYWRLRGSLSWDSEVVADPARGHFEREVKDVYEIYEIQVRAENELGEAHQPPFTYQGRSGEAEPEIVPRDFRRDPSKPLEPHSAHFIWEAVDITDKIRGEFRGYRLQYWKSSEGRHKMQEVDISVTAGRGPGKAPVVRASLMDLPANTPLRAQVAVRNTHYTGVPSMTIDFFTPEGTPSAVRRLIATEVEEEHVVLEWLPPDNPNGRILGFDIGYQAVEGNIVGEVRDLNSRITDPNKLSARITGLQPNSVYRFIVWARTRAGRGRMSFVDIHTKRMTGGRSFYTHFLPSGASPQSTVTSSQRHWALLLTSLCTIWFTLRTLMVFH